MLARTRTCISVGFLVVVSTVSATQDREAMIYSLDFWDKYRDIKYWGDWHVYVRDYKSDTGDARYLGLASKDPNNEFTDVPKKELVEHFNNECRRLLTGKRPHNSVVAAREKWRTEFYNERIAKGGRSAYLHDECDAYVEAKIRSQFGPNPGMVRCTIAISRRTFPVLYEMTSSVNPELNVFNESVQEEKLGYSTPDDILNELKASITEQLEELARQLAKIDRYSSR